MYARYFSFYPEHNHACPTADDTWCWRKQWTTTVSCRTIGCMDNNPFAHTFVHNYFYCLGLGIALVIFNKIKYNSRSKNGTC